MKKKTFIFFLLVALNCAGATQSLTAGNPSETLQLSRSICAEEYFNTPLPYGQRTQWFETINYRFGFSGSYVFDRKMTTNVPKATPGLLNPAYQMDTTNFSINTNSAYFVCNICRNFDFFVTLGGSNFKILGTSDLFNLSGTLNGNQISIPNGFITIQTKSGHSESIGIRYAKEICNTILGLNFEYSRAKPAISFIEVVAGNTQFNLSNNPPQKKNHLEYKEWEIGTTLAKNFSHISTYIGLNCSKSTVNMNKKVLKEPPNTLNPSLGDLPTAGSQLTAVSLKLNALESRVPIGIMLGCSLFFNDNISLTVETKLINQHAIKTTGLIRF